MDKKSDWIRKHLTTHKEQEEEKSNTLRYLGTSYSFEYNITQKESVIHSEGFFSFSEKVQENKTEVLALTNWYRKQARIHLTERVEYFSKKCGFSYGQIRINSATTRWGSCSAHDNLNFPWRLIMAPEAIIDYVVIHELAHTVHKNHSARFWKLVESIVPDWKTHRTHLRLEG